MGIRWEVLGTTYNVKIFSSWFSLEMVTGCEKSQKGYEPIKDTMVRMLKSEIPDFEIFSWESKTRGFQNGLVGKDAPKRIPEQSTAEKTAKLSLEHSRAQERGAETLQRGCAGDFETFSWESKSRGFHNGMVGKDAPKGGPEAERSREDS